MKKLCVLSASLLLLLLTATTANAWMKVACVFCDANTNGIIDAADSPLSGVNVVVTNTSGTFITNGVTGAQGCVILDLPVKEDSYVDFIDSSSLPSGTTQVKPPFNQFSVSANNFNVTNYFLVKSPVCVPPPMTNHCWLTGGGTIGALKQRPWFSFGGVVYPGCKATAAGGGNWNVIDHVNKLHFKATTITVVQCGNLPGFPPGSKSPKTPSNFIDFSGSGTLKGIGGNKTNFGPVFFYARAVDLGEPGKGVDQLYVHVYTAAGDTRLLISSDTAEPDVIAPVTIRSGNLQLHISGCDKQNASTPSNGSTTVHKK